MENIEKYGNELVITGMIVSNGIEAQAIMFADARHISYMINGLPIIQPTEEELKQIFYQLDVLDITNSQKVVLRKSQRQLDAVISWNVFRRDSYTCVYCGNDHTPLTIDHLVLWENGGDTVEGNLLTACKKCNHTRGSKSVQEFLDSDYYLKLEQQLKGIGRTRILNQWVHAKTLSLAKRRSR